MSILRVHQAPLSLGSAKKREVRSQFGAVCYRMHKGRPQVLLITSRGKGRWIIPKGWPMADVTPSDAAEIEAFEEAGVRGTAHPMCLGIYAYQKGSGMPCVVALYAIEVHKLLRRFPERGERKRRWFDTERAAQVVAAPELSRFIENFHPDNLPELRHHGS